ncbi:Ribosomal protein L11 methyltransferase [Pseudovibrio axinellae]|uniref:Ribosomal protein L11 methyltransferase n=1 Tax=Pseudovibrio axinellae TaxID=989403 RepID=A0A166A638_9HYPH|nr:methyltransferase [Pseudovibrio axinellae]KZL20659.1 Ribosomal protein L11 methyltransferase [Pseudovibrio axinellae]SER26555.1 Predicted nicotinamide N-methyase [Pseudovibrio axinellae]
MQLTDRRKFILEQTRIHPVPHAPSISLHLADEDVDLWHMGEDELEALGLPSPFWAFAWAGGQALARYILDNPEVVAGKHILDFASGSGLVAIAAIKAGARSAVAADIDPFAADAALINATLNSVTIKSTTEDLLNKPPSQYDLICCGDVFYDPDMTKRVLNWLHSSDRSKPTHILVGDPQRSYFPASQLTHLQTYEIPVQRELEDNETKKTSVFTFLPQ